MADDRESYFSEEEEDENYDTAGEGDDDIEESEEEEEEEDNGGDDNPTILPTQIIDQPIGEEKENEGEEDDNDEEEEEEDENYLQKFNKEIHKNYTSEIHPECSIHNQEEIDILSIVVRNSHGIIIDDLHKTIPFLTKFERARILGQRTKQINSGAPAFVKIPDKVIDGYIIAQIELIQKVIPFIIRRPLPNGSSEYWKVSDLENIIL